MVGWTHLSRFAAPNSAHCTNAVAMFLCSVSRGEEGGGGEKKIKSRGGHVLWYHTYHVNILWRNAPQ